MSDNNKFADTLAGQMTVQTGGNTLNNLINRLFAKRDRKINWQQSQKYGEREIAWQKQMAEYNQKMSKDYFDYTAEYNNASNQVKRLKDAGLNPGLMYSNGTAAGASGQTGGARAMAPEENYQPMGLPMQQMALRETPAERELKLAQARNLNVQSENSRS